MRYLLAAAILSLPSRGFYVCSWKGYSTKFSSLGVHTSVGESSCIVVHQETPAWPSRYGWCCCHCCLHAENRSWPVRKTLFVPTLQKDEEAQSIFVVDSARYTKNKNNANNEDLSYTHKSLKERSRISSAVRRCRITCGMPRHCCVSVKSAWATTAGPPPPPPLPPPVWA